MIVFVLRLSCIHVCDILCLLPAGDAGRTCGCVGVMLLAGMPANMICEMFAGTPRPLRLPERRLTSVPAISGTPYVPFLAKVMPDFFVKFGMTLLKIGHVRY